MTPPSRPLPPRRGLTIVHAASLLPDDARAFVHAVAIAKASASRLLSIHADGGEGALAKIPRAVDTLVTWGALPEGSAEGDEGTLGMLHIRRAHDCCADDHVETMIDAVRNSPPQLVVATTHTRSVVSRLLFGSVAEGLSRELHAPTLIFPSECSSFVDAASGKSRLAKFIVAAGDTESGAVGTDHARWLSTLLGASSMEVDLVRAERERDIEETLLERARIGAADVIVMATRGHDSVGDVVAGSHTERVLRRAHTPVLVVPLQ